VPVSKGFVAHALDLLSGVGPVQARSMFGGYGLYARGAMFGLLDDDELYLKADAVNRQAFVDAGCRRWVYPGPQGPMAMGYYRPPDGALEEAEAMTPWARLGMEAAARAQAAKAAKAARKKARAGAAPAKRAAPRKARAKARKGVAAGKRRARR